MIKWRYLSVGLMLGLSGCWWQTPNQVRRPTVLTQPPAHTNTAPGPSHPAVTVSHGNQPAPDPILVLPELEPALPPPVNTVPVAPVTDAAPHGDHAGQDAGAATASGSHHHSGSSGGSSGHYSPPVSSVSQTTPQPQHHMEISEIVLTETGESILGADAPASIQTHYEQDYEVSITIRGQFDTAPATRLEHMHFTLEPGILHLGLVGKEPPVRVTLDHTILLTPVSASATEIVATLNTRGIPDLYLKGLHTLTIAAGQLLIERKVKVGEPLSLPASLSPVIHAVDILYNTQQQPINLRVSGEHLMLQPRFGFAQVNGDFAFGHQTAVLNTADGLRAEKIIHLPLPESFDPAADNSLLYLTPYGAAFYTFSEGGL